MSAMKGFYIQEVGKTSKVEILGHVFNGVADIKKAVETYCRIGRDQWHTIPQS